MEKKHNTINDVINELKRLQVEHGDVAVFHSDEYAQDPAWPIFNEKQNVIEV